MAAIVIMAVLALVVWFLIWPLMPQREAKRVASEAAERAELEAQRDVKLREIRDLELDWRTGKIAEADYKELDRKTRQEAIVILRKLDALGPGETETAQQTASA